jgi:hypothetical protein
VEEGIIVQLEEFDMMDVKGKFMPTTKEVRGFRNFESRRGILEKQTNKRERG